MTWIETVDPAEARGKLKRLYEQIQSPGGQVDNILRAHSLRPRTLEAHLALYRAVLHSRPRELSARECELVGVCVSTWNGCDYCVRHHQAGLAKIVGNAELAASLVAAGTTSGSGSATLGTGTVTTLTAREHELCCYAKKLTLAPGDLTPDDLVGLRRAGLSDTAILEVNQVVSYFAYANRTVLGLGVEIAGEALGEHPDADSDEPYRHF